MKDRIKVGIIGGTGEVGQFFKKFFEQNNCTVLISSRKTKLNSTDCAKQCDVVMISVPISSTTQVIRKVGPHVRNDALLIDVTSVKKEPVGAMLKYSKSEVVGMHPVFGPNVSSIKNQTVVLCRARGSKWLNWIQNLLEQNKATVRITTPKKHDEMMSLIQGLNHFSTLSVAHAMKKIGVDVKKTLEFTSPIYKLRMAVVGRILNQNPELYASLEIDNPSNNKVLQAYMDSSRRNQRK